MTIYEIIKELGITEGWSPVYGECEIELDRELNAIVIIGSGRKMVLNNNGTFVEQGECLIFPSKDNRDWEKELERKRIQLLSKGTPVMISNNGKDWSLKYYRRERYCSSTKDSVFGYDYRYIVPVSEFYFNEDDLSINIINSI